jgi:hypothetical protein
MNWRSLMDNDTLCGPFTNIKNRPLYPVSADAGIATNCAGKYCGIIVIDSYEWSRCESGNMFMVKTFAQNSVP